MTSDQYILYLVLNIIVSLTESNEYIIQKQKKIQTHSEKTCDARVCLLHAGWYYWCPTYMSCGHSSPSCCLNVILIERVCVCIRPPNEAVGQKTDRNPPEKRSTLTLCIYIIIQSERRDIERTGQTVLLLLLYTGQKATVRGGKHPGAGAGKEILV